MAKIKITESEMRNLIKIVIKESNMSHQIVEIEMEDVELLNGEITSFGLSANVSKYGDGDYDIFLYRHTKSFLHGRHHYGHACRCLLVCWKI